MVAALKAAGCADLVCARGLALPSVNFISGVLPEKARLDTAGVIKVNCT
jgi:hypothetical protein